MTPQEDNEKKPLTIDEREAEIQAIVKDIAKNMREIRDMVDKTAEYAQLFYKVKRELETMNKRCVAIEDHIKNCLGRAILLSNYKYTGSND